MRKQTLFKIALAGFFLSLSLAAAAWPASQEKPAVILATTTSTVDTGLLDELIPVFEKESGYVVKTIAVGSGQAMAMGRRGEADLLLVHSPADEETFMREGFGTRRMAVMHNDFILTGPAADPAGVKSAATILDALQQIAKAQALFVSRADKSGTHSRELQLWKKAGLDPAGQPWYLETGTGMGQTLAVAAEKKAYTVSDRGTFLVLKEKLGLFLVREGDAQLLNIYHVIEVSGERFLKVNAAGARALADFFVTPATQRQIGQFGAAKFSRPLFVPDALPGPPATK